VRLDAADDPGLLAGGAQQPQAPAARSAATQAIMPTPQLKVRSISARSMLPASRSQRNTGGGVQLRRSITALVPGGRERGRFSVMPPPVMCARAWTPPWRISASAVLA
jgi:hypothetical protein